MNKVILIGRPTGDPEMRFIAGSGMAVVAFTIAIDKELSKQKKEEFKAAGKPTADFPRCKALGKTAEFCGNHVAKGKKVAVIGHIQTGSYEKDGRKVYTTEVFVEKVEIMEWKDSNSGGNNFNQDQGQTNFNQTQQQNGFDQDGFQAIEDDDDIPF